MMTNERQVSRKYTWYMNAKYAYMFDPYDPTSRQETFYFPHKRAIDYAKQRANNEL